MGSVVARNDTFIGGIDFIWARIGGSAILQNPDSALYGGKTSLTLNEGFITAFGGVRVPLGMPNLSLYGTVGARNFYSGTKLAVSGPFGLFNGTETVNKDWINPVAGFAAQYRYDDHWFMNMLADLGGWSDSATGQALASVGYNWTQNFATTVGYRVMYNYTHQDTGSTPSPWSRGASAISSGCTGLSPGPNTASDPSVFERSPALESAGDALHECGSPGRSVEVHVVEGEILEAAFRIDQRANVVAHETPRRIAFGRDVAAALAIGAHGRHALDVLQVGMKQPRFVDAGGDARQKHALEISLHDRGQAVEPDRKYEHERFGGPQALNVAFDFARVGARVDVVEKSLARHDRVELLRIEVEIVDDMPAGAQDLDNARVQRGNETRLQRMREDDKNAQATLRLAPRVDSAPDHRAQPQ